MGHCSRDWRAITRGIYLRANEGLALKKYFVLSFGNIFQTAIASDPFVILPTGLLAMPAVSLDVCDEQSITIVLGWSNATSTLSLRVVTPAGTVLTPATPGVFSSSGNTWLQLRLELPFNAERAGTWQIDVTRAPAGALTEETCFVTVTAVGGPVMKPLLPRRQLYTGDLLNPQVVLRYPVGYQVEDAEMVLDIESPLAGTGNLLRNRGLGPATAIGGDRLDARTSTLIQMEQAQGGTLIGTVVNSYPLYDDGVRDGDNALEPDGVFGNPLVDALREEGHYVFHARARYGHTCRGAREAMWSTYVSVGIDPGRTRLQIVASVNDSAGRRRITVRFTPQDRYGNTLGPGRADQFTVLAVAGSSPTGPARDLGEGSYHVDVLWDPAVAPQPAIALVQPDRPPVTISGSAPEQPRGPMVITIVLAVLLLIALFVIMLR